MSYLDEFYMVGIYILNLSLECHKLCTLDFNKEKVDKVVRDFNFILSYIMLYTML